MKKLVIIHGVTGAIGSACLAHFASQKDTIVYGISRKAKDFTEFCVDGKLPITTLICSISSETYASRMAHYFTEAISSEMFSEIYYIHAVGLYPFEIDKKGNRFVEHDNDADGINDRCQYLTKDLFSKFCLLLSSRAKKPVRSFLFGSIADKYEPFAHMSWWKTMKELKEIITYGQNKNGKFGTVSIVNISSVLCPHELIIRPFVFTATDANPEYWLSPNDVTLFISSLIEKGQKQKFQEYELFKKLPDFDKEYYEDKFFTPRKIAELYK